MELSKQEERDRWQQALHDSVSVSDKNWRMTVVLSVFGIFGLDRFYVGRPLLGVAKLLTSGGFLVWWIADLALVLSGKMKDGDGRSVRKPQRNT
jgi:hypothetical protein